MIIIIVNISIKKNNYEQYVISVTQEENYITPVQQQDLFLTARDHDLSPAKLQNVK